MRVIILRWDNYLRILGKLCVCVYLNYGRLENYITRSNIINKDGFEKIKSWNWWNRKKEIKIILFIVILNSLGRHVITIHSLLHSRNPRKGKQRRLRRHPPNVASAVIPQCSQEDHHFHLLLCVAAERIFIFSHVLQPRESSSSSPMCCS